MIKEEFERSALLLGDDGIKRLGAATVAVFGIGGVGGHAAEALARCGVGKLVLVDGDTVAHSNINRQTIATHSTLGMQKTEAARLRLSDISPECNIITHPTVYSESTRDEFDFSGYDYIVDAIDDIPAKIDIIARATECGVPIISAMGAGNKLDPTRFRVSDISKTAVCPLARVVRTKLRAIGINHLKVVYSDEPPVRQRLAGEPVGSVSFVPSVMGLIIAGEVIKDISEMRVKS